MKTLIGVLGALFFALPAFASAATIQVSMGDATFNAKNITINAGDTVVWTNTSTMAHTVTADNGSFASANIAPGQSYSRTFSTSGTFNYYCTYHGGSGGVGMAGSVTVLAPTVQAAATTNTQSSSDLQSQAQALLQQVAQLQAQLAAQGQTTGTTGGVTTLNTNPTGAINVSNTTGVNSASCPNIGRVLKAGSSGDDVTRLQQFLATDPSVYPEGLTTGYYGALTEKAVQRWQTKYNVVSSGSPATTGFGVVGPRTAAAIALLCSTGGGSSSPVGGYIQVSPISGNAPLNVNVVATINSTNSCASAIYLLNWGDGTNPVSIPVSANTCGPLSQTYQHSYTAGGTYQITLSAGSHQTGATIMVYGNSSTGTTGTTGGTVPTNTTIPNETFNATPTSGSVPLTVTFSGVVTGNDQGWCSSGCSDILTFGDGAQGAVPLPTSQTAAQNYTLTHTYTTAGTYTATLYQGQSGSGRPIVGSVTISAGGASVATFNAPSITPGVGGNPLAVNVAFDYSLSSCSYTINWGDGVTDTSPGGCTGSGTGSKTVSHTYTSAGTRTITLSRDGQTNTAAVNIVQ